MQSVPFYNCKPVDQFLDRYILDHEVLLIRIKIWTELKAVILTILLTKNKYRISILIKGKSYLWSRLASQTSYYHWGSSAGIGRIENEQTVTLQIRQVLYYSLKVAIPIEVGRIHI